jgi:hypothetical protein
VTLRQTVNETCLGIAGIVVRACSSDSSLKIGLNADMQRFSTPSTNPDLSIDVSWQTFAGKRTGEKIFDSGGSWQLYLKDDAYWFYCTAPEISKTPYAVACLSSEFHSGRIFLHRQFFGSHQTVYPLQYPLDELLFLKLLSQGKGIEVHACGIVDVTGDGWLFIGHSGAGKTTLARIWEKEPGVAILSDDRIILKQEEKRLWMYGTPWHGEADLALPSRAPLKHIFFAQHDQKNSLKSKTGAEAAALLFSRSFPVFYSPDGLEFAIDFCGEIAHAIPCSDLGVVPDRGIIDFIRETQQQASV